MNKMWNYIKDWFIEMGSPPLFFKWSSKILPWLMLVTFVVFILGLAWGLFYSPTDYKQGDVYRIIYIHVPSAILGQSIFMFMAVCGFITMVWRVKISGMLLKSAAPIGASFTLLALLTGSIWGKPTWGTWWVWDARLTSELILFFIYIGHILISNAYEDKTKGDRNAAILALLGIVNLPVIKWSVDWWNTLHQPASISKFSSPSIDIAMMTPLIFMSIAFLSFFISLILLRIKGEILIRKIDVIKFSRA